MMLMTPESNDGDRFDRWSRTYEDSWLQSLFFDRVHHAMLALIASDTKPESILDVGCGTGRLLRKAGARWPGVRLIGVDPSEGMIAVARNLTPEATFSVGAAESLPLPDASVAVVVSTASFHHWRDEMAGLREVARACSVQEGASCWPIPRCLSGYRSSSRILAPIDRIPLLRS